MRSKSRDFRRGPVAVGLVTRVVVVARSANLIEAAAVHVRIALADELHGELVQADEVIGSEVLAVLPIETEPLDVAFD